MSESRRIVNTLKQTLRARRITYADVARHLGLSEASVKRMFSRASFSLERLERIAGLAGVTVAELAEMAGERPRAVTRLGSEAERALLADARLLLVALLTLNGWTPEEIAAAFVVDVPEIIGHLAHLDRLGLVELLPGNRVRRRVARNFSWRSHGPVASYFEREVKRDFLDSRFAGTHEHLRFVGGLVSHTSLRRLHRGIDRLANELDERVQEDEDLPLADKVGVGAVLAIRPWEVPAFRALRRRHRA